MNTIIINCADTSDASVSADSQSNALNMLAPKVHFFSEVSCAILYIIIVH